MILLLTVPALLLLIPVFCIFSKRTSPEDRERKRVREGIALFEQNNLNEAFSFFDHQIRSGKKSAVTYLYRGLCHAANQNLHSALYDLTTALSYDNSLAEVYYERGKIYLKKGEVDRAILEFERAQFYSKNTRADVFRYRGISLMQKGQYFQAARYLNKAVELGDEEANFHLMAPPFHNSFGLSKDRYETF